MLLPDGALLAISGIGNEAATRAACALADAGATALVSWGMAGALDPKVRAGQLLLPSTVITPDGTQFHTAAQWRARLAHELAGRLAVCEGLLLTSPVAIDTLESKAAALRATQALAVDMESAAVARVAAARALPFIAIRAIVDTAVDVLPRSVLVASRAGQVQRWRLARELALAPGEIASLLHLARRFHAAKRTLLLVARAGLVHSSASSVQVA